MEIWLEKLGYIALLAVAVKAMTIGSSFSFLLWIKYGSKYTDWYFEKETQKFPEDN